jgi:Na+/H+ antiporter NhaD/arsenite permease-like protein
MRKIFWVFSSVVLLSAPLLLAGEPESAHGAVVLGEVLPVWSIIPFVGILLSIALFPLFAPKFWHHHYGKVSTFWSLAVAIPFVVAYGHPAFHEIIHIILIDYLPFIILLLALFTVAGGILVEGTLKGKPLLNSLLLLIGTVIASWTGTTGASMLLIRPVIRANAHRKNKMHVIVFFIFLVSNIGGALTPLGDPPLFLGFLHGVPFFWTFQLIPETVFAVAVVLAAFFLMDTWFYKREAREGLWAVDSGERVPLRIRGAHNLIFLGGIVGAVLMSGMMHTGEVTLLGVPLSLANLLRDLFLLVMVALSLATTARMVREKNEFTWGPIVEVALLFAGIFITIIPALAMLRAGTRGELAFIINAVKEPWHYFWITGALSSFLDNAPTYLTFLNTALGNFFAGMPERQAIAALIAEKGLFLKAISTGAVFMGANTYIGNAPNFMVRSIAEEQGIKMPSFFGYMAYSLLILIPTFLLITIIFF